MNHFLASPFRKLLLATLLAVVLIQIVALALVSRSQVQRAELRELSEKSGHATATSEPLFVGQSAMDGAMTVGYVEAR